MRHLVVGDQVWVKSEGGSPWTVTWVDGNRCAIANATRDRAGSAANLQLVTEIDPHHAPTMDIPKLHLPRYAAFAKAFPDRIGDLDLCDRHIDELKAEILTTQNSNHPTQTIETGAAVQIKDGQHKGQQGKALCYDPRDDAYVVRCAIVPYLLVVPSDWVAAIP